MWGYPEYRGGVQYRGGYHEYHGVILSTVGCSVLWGDIMMHMGDIMNTVGVFSTVEDIMIHVGDIMSTVGVFSTVGYSNNKRFPPRY